MNDELQRTALALRDLLEMSGALGARLTFDNGTVLDLDETRITLIPANGQQIDITPLVEWTGLVPA